MSTSIDQSFYQLDFYIQEFASLNTKFSSEITSSNDSAQKEKEIAKL
jgi:hypothetical protein